MRLCVLGCAGSIADNRHTSSYLIDNDVLIDAGTGLGTLSLDELAAVDHVFLSHSHMDHIAALPMVVDTVLDRRDKPLVVHALQETLDVLSEHVFNWKVVPDFRTIIAGDHPALEFSAVRPGVPVRVGSRTLTAVPVRHTVPAAAYHVAGPGGSIMVAPDMTVSENFWPTVNAIADLRHLVIETAFNNDRIGICHVAGHLCPSLLEKELRHFTHPAQVCIVHMKPSAAEQIRREITALNLGRPILFLKDGDVLEI
jgi:cAMP phosphodiesterase